MNNKDILFLLRYPIQRAPSQRFRVENLLFLLDEANMQYDVNLFFSQADWYILYKKGNLFQKAFSILRSFFKRWHLILFKSTQYKFIFVQREAAPLGPPLIEWYLSKVLNKKIIFDFDDAIWIPSSKSTIVNFAKYFGKIKDICKWSYKVTGGNDYLCNFAIQSGAQNVIKIPTVVNMESRYNKLKQHQSHKLVIGWTGSYSTLKFLDDLMPILQDLQKEYSFTFMVIADKNPELDLENWIFCPWNEATEIEDLMKIDIGVMPLKNDPWCEGKCGFKLIQYLALGIPAVANSVGVNKIIIEDGINGFIADDAATWKSSLKMLLEDEHLRAKLGAEGKRKMKNEYSITSQKDKFLSLFS